MSNHTDDCPRCGEDRRFAHFGHTCAARPTPDAPRDEPTRCYLHEEYFSGCEVCAEMSARFDPRVPPSGAPAPTAPPSRWAPHTSAGDCLGCQGLRNAGFRDAYVNGHHDGSLASPSETPPSERAAASIRAIADRLREIAHEHDGSALFGILWSLAHRLDADVKSFSSCAPSGTATAGLPTEETP